MANANRLVSAGMTNHNSEDYGTIASAKNERINFALCCGEMYQKITLNDCPKCKKALFWHYEPRGILERKLERERRLWRLSQEIIERNQAATRLNMLKK